MENVRFSNNFHSSFGKVNSYARSLFLFSDIFFLLVKKQTYLHEIEYSMWTSTNTNWCTIDLHTELIFVNHIQIEIFAIQLHNWNSLCSHQNHIHIKNFHCANIDRNISPKLWAQNTHPFGITKLGYRLSVCIVSSIEELKEGRPCVVRHECWAVKWRKKDRGDKCIQNRDFMFFIVSVKSDDCFVSSIVIGLSACISM